jgi:hypothetical protein
VVPSVGLVIYPASSTTIHRPEEFTSFHWHGSHLPIRHIYRIQCGQHYAMSHGRHLQPSLCHNEKRSSKSKAPRSQMPGFSRAGLCCELGIYIVTLHVHAQNVYRRFRERVTLMASILTPVQSQPPAQALPPPPISCSREVQCITGTLRQVQTAHHPQWSQHPDRHCSSAAVFRCFDGEFHVLLEKREGALLRRMAEDGKVQQIEEFHRVRSTLRGSYMGITEAVLEALTCDDETPRSSTIEQ